MPIYSVLRYSTFCGVTWYHPHFTDEETSLVELLEVILEWAAASPGDLTRACGSLHYIATNGLIGL